MRSLYNSELRTKAMLDDAGIVNFLPLRWDTVEAGGRRIKIQVSLVRNLIFVKSSPQELEPIVRSNPRFQHIYCRGGAKHQPLIVPDGQMEDFIKAVESSEEAEVLSPDELPLRRGQWVRISGGSLDGVVGRFMRVKGARSKRLVVEIPRLLAAVVEVDPSSVHPVDDPPLFGAGGTPV